MSRADAIAVQRAKALLCRELHLTDTEASRRIRRAAYRRGEGLADTAARVWERRETLARSPYI